MATTANVIDTRIEPQPPLVFLKSTAPKQNQFYKIPASALSNTFVAFNNLTTLGADRAYLDTFELEITAELTFTGDAAGAFKPEPDEWVFDSFPFNKCCEEARVNINGGAFFSQPLSYVRAKERYWNEMKINASYENVCPCNKPHLQNEMAIDMAAPVDAPVTKEGVARMLNAYYNVEGQSNATATTTVTTTLNAWDDTAKTPIIRSGVFHTGSGGNTPDTLEETYHRPYVTGSDQEISYNVNAQDADQTSQTVTVGALLNQTGGSPYQGTHTRAGQVIATGSNIQLPMTSVAETTLTGVPGTNSFKMGAAAPTRLGAGSTYYMPTASGLLGGGNNSIVRRGTYGDSVRKYEWLDEGRTLHVIVQWREPVFASPFSSRIDSSFGRPLYNITSIDLAFNMQNLGNMIRVGHLRGEHYVQNYTVNLQSVQLCYQVETVPPGFPVPKETIVPYRRMVPYITDFPGNKELSEGGQTVTMTSGVYTLNEIPTAIWIFAAPTKNIYQTNPSDSPLDPAEVATFDDTDMRKHGCWASNKLFGFIKHVSLSMANTTQILNTADLPDLYRIAKSNGCQDSFRQWGISDMVDSRLTKDSAPGETTYIGPGSVLRLIPGQDIVLPEQELIPGANANNMVFQCEATFDIPPHAKNLGTYALWLLFEYVGMATISVGKCNITMNPLGNGAAMRNAPVVSATSDMTEGEAAQGAGIGDILARILGMIKNKKLVSKALRGISQFAEDEGYGEMDFGPTPAKRARGGAVMGFGDFL